MGNCEHAGAIPYGDWKGNDQQSATLSVEAYAAVAVISPRSARSRDLNDSPDALGVRSR